MKIKMLGWFFIIIIFALGFLVGLIYEKPINDAIFTIPKYFYTVQQKGDSVIIIINKPTP